MTYPNVLQVILQSLESQRSTGFGHEDLRHWPEGVLQSFLAAGLLRESGYARSVICRECPDGCSVEVQFVRDEYGEETRAFFDCPERDDIRRVWVPLDELRTYALSPNGLAEWLARELRADGIPSELIPSRLWMLGKKIGDITTDVLLARGLTWPDGERVLREARSRKRSQTAVILVPACAGDDAATDSSFRIMPLGGVLALGDGGMHLDVSAIQEAVSGSALLALGGVQDFRASKDYRCVWLHGVQFKPLSPMQAEIVRILDEGRKAGEPIMTHAAILSKMDSPPVRLSDIFRSSDPRKVLIERIGKDTYRLNI